MKTFQKVMSLVLCMTIITTCIIGTSAISGTKAGSDIKHSSDSVTALKNAAKNSNGTDYNIWSEIDQSKDEWHSQYFDEIEQKYVEFPKSKIGTWSDPPSDDFYAFGIGANEPSVGLQGFAKDSESPHSKRVHLTPHKAGSGYSKVALSYYVPTDGDYYIGTQKDFDAVMAMFKNTKPEYYQDYAVATDKYSFAIYKNDEKLFPDGNEPYAYLTPDNLSFKLDEFKETLKKGDIIRYVTDGATSPGSDPWMKGIVIHPWIYLDVPPRANDMKFVATPGFETPEMIFDFIDESGKNLTFNIVDQPEKGIVAITNAADGAFRYTANADAAPDTSDFFTFTVSNGVYTSEKATITVDIVKNQLAYPKNTQFSVLQDMPLVNESLRIYDPDPSFNQTACHDPLAYLLKQAWDTAPAEVDLDNFWAAHADVPANGDWRVEYNLSEADRTWKPMEFLYKWNFGGNFTNYPGGKNVCYSTQSSIDGKQVYFAVESPLSDDGAVGTYDPTKPVGRFKLTTAITDPFKGDPQGSLLFTFKESGTYRIMGNPDAPKVGIPDREWLRPSYNPNIKLNFWIEKNGTEISGTKMTFTTGHLEEDFPDLMIKAEVGDTIRFVADGASNWGGWMQQMTMSPMISKGTSSSSCTLRETTEHGQLTLDPSGNFNYTPDAGYFGTDSFIVNVDDGNDNKDYTITISVLEDRIPICDAKCAATTVGGKKDIILTGIDDHNKPLTYKIVSQPTNGSATIDGNKLSYQAVSGFNGFDIINVSCNDGRFESKATEIKVLMTDKSYDAVTQFINMIQEAEECIDGDKTPSFLPNAIKEPWRVQYFYKGITGNINYETSRVYETAVSGLWLKDGEWQGYAVNDDMVKCPGITIEGVNGLSNENAIFISSGYKNNDADPVGALAFFAPEDGTYLLLPEEKMPYFSPNLNTRTDLQKPIEFWIEKDGKQIWPADGKPMKVGAKDNDNLMPSFMVSLKKGSKIRFCTKSFAENNGDKLGCIVRPLAYLAGEYQASLDPNPDGEAEIVRPDPPKPGVDEDLPEDDNVNDNLEDGKKESEDTADNEEPKAETIINDPVNGIYTTFDFKALKRQIAVAENNMASIKILNPGVLTEEMLNLLKEKTLGLRVEICDQDGNSKIIWEFMDLMNQTDAIPLAMSNTSKYQDQINVIYEGSKTQVASFKNNVTLSGKTRITILNEGNFAAGEKLYLYRLNYDNGEMELCDTKVMLSGDKKYIRFDVDRSTEYVVSTMANKKTMKITEEIATGLPVYAIVLIVAGAVLLLAAVAALVIILIKRKARNKIL